MARTVARRKTWDLLPVASVVLLLVASVVRLRDSPRWAGWVVRLQVASAVLRRIRGSAVRRRNSRVFRNNNRWEWEELQCKVVRECKRRRVGCSRIRVVRVVR